MTFVYQLKCYHLQNLYLKYSYCMFSLMIICVKIYFSSLLHFNLQYISSVKQSPKALLKNYQPDLNLFKQVLET